jgi:hypothetical protein
LGPGLLNRNFLEGYRAEVRAAEASVGGLFEHDDLGGLSPQQARTGRVHLSYAECRDSLF